MSTIRNKLCNQSSYIRKKNTLLEKYYLHERNNKNNLLAVKLLESKIKISHRLG